MKKITKRFYDFTFEQLAELLKLKGSFCDYQVKKGESDIQIITQEEVETEAPSVK